MSVVKVRHPEYGYVTFHNMTIRQKEILQLLKGRIILDSPEKKLKFALTKTTKNG